MASSVRSIPPASDWWKSVRNPPRYLQASLIVALCGLLNGLDTGTIGPVTTMSSFRESFGPLSSAMHGWIISCVCLMETISSVFAGALSDSLGRPRVITIGAVAFSVGAAMEAGAVDLVMLIVGRCIVGLGQGIFLSTLVVYICEIAPPNKRGTLVTMVQLLITFGICAGYFVSFGTSHVQSSFSWRLPLALQSGIAFSVAVSSSFYLPQSPRWLTYKGRRDEANQLWDSLGVSAAEREKQTLQIPSAATSNPTGVIENPNSNDLGFLGRVRSDIASYATVFQQDALKPMLLGVFLMSMQQLSGIDGVLFYAPLLFQQAGISSSEAAFLASGVSAILIFVFTIVAVLLVDRWGRRDSTIYGGLLLSACMTLMGSLYATHSVHAGYGLGRWVVIVAIYIFAITYSMTWAIGVKLFASEIQPVGSRAVATSLSQSANCIANFFVAFITPVLLASSSSGIYFLFGGATLITVAVGALFMPETRGHDLETLVDMFRLHKVKDAPVVKSVRGIRTWISGIRSGGSHRGGILEASGSEIDGIELESLRVRAA